MPRSNNIVRCVPCGTGVNLRSRHGSGKRELAVVVLRSLHQDREDRCFGAMLGLQASDNAARQMVVINVDVRCPAMFPLPKPVCIDEFQGASKGEVVVQVTVSVPLVRIELELLKYVGLFLADNISVRIFLPGAGPLGSAGILRLTPSSALERPPLPLHSSRASFCRSPMENSLSDSSPSASASS